MIASVSVFFGAAGCNQIPQSVMEQMEQAFQELDAKDYNGCEQMLNPIITSYGHSAGIAPAYYMRGQCRLRKAQREQAQMDFNTARYLTKDKKFRSWIDAQLGNIAFDDGSYGQACIHYRDAAKHMPQRPPADRVLYQYGVALQRTKQFANAREILRRVFTEFPSSQCASQARRKYSWDRDHYAIQCGSFSTLESANQEASRLRQEGVDAIAYPEFDDNGRKRFVIRVGRFTSYLQANRRLEAVRRVQPDAFIVP